MISWSIAKSRYFWKLYASYAILVLITTALIGFLFDYQMEKALEADLKRTLQRQTSFLALRGKSLFSLALPQEIQQEVERLGRETQTRVTLMFPDGRVLADSDEDPVRMENHAQRPEFIQALQIAVGSSKRYSDTSKKYFYYVAEAVKSEGKILGVARVAVPIEYQEERSASVRITVLVGMGIGIVAALVIGLFVTQKTTGPIFEMIQVAEAIRKGHYEKRVRPMPRDEFGKLGEALNHLCVELTEKIATVSRDQAQLHAILSSMVEGVLAVDGEDQVLFCNRAAGELLGSEDLLTQRKKIWELVHVIDLLDLLARVRYEGKPARREIVLRSGGREMILEGAATPFEGGLGKGIVVVLHDLTGLRKLERIRRDFVANVSHELKTPLTTIKGYVETLLSGALHDETNNVRFLEKIEAHVNRLSYLVRDLLSLARIESEEHATPLSPAEWQPVVEECLKNYEVVLMEKNLTAAVEPPSEPVVVPGNSEAMAQVIDNLLDNAVKYTPVGGKVTIRIYVQDGQGCLDVEDTGIGIPEQDLERIFERFYRVDKARSRELGGTGLGLSIVKHLVQSMHGTVAVASQIGKGSRFTVKIPLAK
ncbi:MAG: PAS domain-containing protein [Planctomycetes bacterium]|nr:PAS domain-containing protein [Planctomycetota bacterium]